MHSTRRTELATAIAALTREQEQPVLDFVPTMWLLLGERPGDNTQVRGLGEALGWPFIEKRLRFNAWHHNRNLFLGASRRAVDPSGSDVLEPPWPDLVIAAGRRNAPVARWIRRRSGGRTKLVHIGRPWAPVRWFDLVITTPQYGVPWRPNVLINAAPLHSVTPERLAAAAVAWDARLKPLPRPWIALIVGGPTRPYEFEPADARALGEQAARLAAAEGGSLLATTSSRTPVFAASVLREAIGSVPHHFFEWHPAAPENPYFAYLALADRFIVTGDSISMMTEATATGRPVAVARPRLGPRLIGPKTARTPPISFLVDLGLVPHPRDIGAFCDKLIATGRAHELGTPRPTKTAPAPEDMARALERVHALFRTSR